MIAGWVILLSLDIYFRNIKNALFFIKAFLIKKAFYFNLVYIARAFFISK